MREVGALPPHLDVPLQELLLTENCSGVATVQKNHKKLSKFFELIGGVAIPLLSQNWSKDFVDAENASRRKSIQDDATLPNVLTTEVCLHLR